MATAVAAAAGMTVAAYAFWRPVEAEEAVGGIHHSPGPDRIDLIPDLN